MYSGVYVSVVSISAGCYTLHITSKRTREREIAKNLGAESRKDYDTDGRMRHGRRQTFLNFASLPLLWQKRAKVVVFITTREALG